MALPQGGVGSSGVKYEANELALGDRGYVDDIRVDGMLHAGLKLSDHARADILAIDTSRALAHPGVQAVFTAADIPGELRVGIIHKDWPVMIPVGGRTSYLGDVLAIVVADDRITARAAVELVDVTYEVHPAIADPEAAVAPGAPDAVWQLDGNVLSTSTYSAGRRRGRAGRLRPRGARRPSTPSASSTPSSSPSRPSPCPPPTAGSTSTPAARACGTTATRSRRCSPSTPPGSPCSSSPTAAPSAARRTCRTRGRRRSPPGSSAGR